MFANYFKLTEYIQSFTKQFIENGQYYNKTNPALIWAEHISPLWQSWLNNPSDLLQSNVNLLADYVRLCQYLSLRSMGFDTQAVASPDKSDRRFKDEDWDNQLIFDCIKQFYLVSSRHILSTVSQARHLDDKMAKKIEFYTSQWLDALSPTNFIATNPAVISETINSKGENLIKGFQAMMNDFQRGKGKKLLTKMTDHSAFEVGKNVATTPGKVIFENELMQLIQYAPSKKMVFEIPLLIVPPWINKYYILDLSKENSFIKWAVDQGHSVFVISWVNPDDTFAQTQFEDYMTKGVITAIDTIKKETGVHKVNSIGYCVGGTLLAATNAWFATKRSNPINSSTFFAAMIDFEHPGDLGVFIDEAQLDSLETEMAKDGYLEGTTMATVFNMLRANDLIWPFFINNYLLGKEPAAFDLLYWNSDSTRLPAATHSFYLKTCYLQNKLKEPGGITLADTPIDISKIKTPAYFIGTQDDHITPWKSVYESAKLLSGDVHFILGGSGHIAGIINLPANNKYNYWTNKTLTDRPEQWLENAECHTGSWWPDWQKWIKKQAGETVKAREPGKKLGVIEEAPGSYVKHRIVPD